MPGMLEFRGKKLSLHSAADAAEHIYGSLEILFDGELYQFGGDVCLQSWLECLRRLSKFVAGGDATRDPTTFITGGAGRDRTKWPYSFCTTY